MPPSSACSPSPWCPSSLCPIEVTSWSNLPVEIGLASLLTVVTGMIWKKALLVIYEVQVALAIPLAVRPGPCPACPIKGTHSRSWEDGVAKCDGTESTYHGVSFVSVTNAVRTYTHHCWP